MQKVGAEARTPIVSCDIPAAAAALAAAISSFFQGNSIPRLQIVRIGCLCCRLFFCPELSC